MLITKRRLAVMAAIPALALSAACGAQSFASTGSPSPAQSAAAKPSWYETAVKFAGCMRENGIDIPDPVKGQDLDTSAVSKVTQAKLDAAMKACKEWDSVILGSDEPLTPEEQAKSAAYAKCLQDGGIWSPVGDEEKPAGFKEVNLKSAAAKKIFDSCKHLAPPAPWEEG